MKRNALFYTFHLLRHSINIGATLNLHPYVKDNILINGTIYIIPNTTLRLQVWLGFCTIIVGFSFNHMGRVADAQPSNIQNKV
jgi:hypothetical protein